MKHIFHKSFVLVSFFSAVTIVLILGISLIGGQSAEANVYSNDSMMIWGLTALMIIILLLNISDIIAYWINGKAQEIRAKYIVGIKEKTIFSRIYLNLNFLNILSFFVGLAASVATAYIISSVSAYLVVKISFLAIFLAFAFNVVLLNAISILILKYKLRNGYMGLRQ